jgi:hypothetical protein
MGSSVTTRARVPGAGTHAAPPGRATSALRRRAAPPVATPHLLGADDVVALGQAAGNEAVATRLQREPQPMVAVQRAGEPSGRKEGIQSVKLLAGGAMNLGVLEVTGESGSYIVKFVDGSGGVHRSVFADRVLRRFGVEDTGARAVTGSRAYALASDMLAAPRIVGDQTREVLEGVLSRLGVRALIMNQKTGAAWREEEFATPATAQQFMQPGTMEELGKIFAIDTLLGNLDRMRHSRPLQSADAAPIFDPLGAANHPDNILTTQRGLAPIDQDTVLPGPSADEFHYDQQGRMTPDQSLSSSPETYTRFATDAPGHGYQSPGGRQRNLEPRYGHMKLSHLVNDRYLDQVATGIVRGTDADTEVSREAFRRGVTGIVTQLGDRATRRDLTHALDDVYRDADPDERALLDKGTLRMRMKFLGGLGRERAGLQGSTPEALAAIDSAATRGIAAVRTSIGTERWLHAPETSDSADKLARWAPAVEAISIRRLNKATRLMDPRRAPPTDDRLDSMRRHVLALMNRTNRELTKPTVADSPHRATLERALVNFGRAAAKLGPTNARQEARRRTGDAAEAPNLRASWTSRAGSGGGWFKRLVPALALAAAAGVGTAAALSGSFRNTLTGSVNMFGRNVGPMGAWIGGGIALLGLAGFAAGRYAQKRARAKHALAIDPHAPRALARGTSVALYPPTGAPGPGVATGGPLTLLPEAKGRGSAGYTVCTVVSGNAPPEQRRVRQEALTALPKVDPADANPRIPRDYRRPSETTPLVDQEVEHDDAMRRYRELAARPAAPPRGPGVPPIAAGAAPLPLVEEAGRAGGGPPVDVGAPRGPEPAVELPHEDDRSLARVLAPPGAAVDPRAAGLR